MAGGQSPVPDGGIYSTVDALNEQMSASSSPAAVRFITSDAQSATALDIVDDNSQDRQSSSRFTRRSVSSQPVGTDQKSSRFSRRSVSSQTHKCPSVC